MITAVSITIAILLLMYGIGATLLLGCLISYQRRLENRLQQSHENNVALRQSFEHLVNIKHTEKDPFRCSLN